MNTTTLNKPQPGAADFDLFRLGESKITVNLSPNTLRNYHREGLPFYGQGRTIFVSKNDLAAFLKNRSIEKVSPETNNAKAAPEPAKPNSQ